MSGSIKVLSKEQSITDKEHLRRLTPASVTLSVVTEKEETEITTSEPLPVSYEKRWHRFELIKLIHKYQIFRQTIKICCVTISASLGTRFNMFKVIYVTLFCLLTFSAGAKRSKMYCVRICPLTQFNIWIVNKSCINNSCV